MARLPFTRPQRIFGVATVAILAVGLSACSSGAATQPSSTATAGGDAFANASGTVTLYSSLSQELTDDASKAFTAKYPNVQVSEVRLATGDLAARFEAEAQSGAPVADVFIGSDPAFAKTMYGDKYFAKIDAKTVPAYGKLDSSFVSDYYAATDSTPISVSYNTDQVKKSDIPKSWKDVVDAKWKGKVLEPDPRANDIWIALFILLEKKYGKSYLTKFGDLNPTLVASAVPGAQQVAAGEFALQVPSAVTVTPALIAQGAPIADVIPTGVSTGIEHYLSLTTKGAKSEAARAFANWALGPDGAAILDKGVYSALPNVPGAISLPKDYVALPLDQVPAEKASILAAIGLK